MHICDWFWENRPKRGKQFFFSSYHRVKPYGSIFFENFFMAEMDRHQLALAYDAVEGLACSRTHTRRLETLAGWTFLL